MTGYAYYVYSVYFHTALSFIRCVQASLTWPLLTQGTFSYISIKVLTPYEMDLVIRDNIKHIYLIINVNNISVVHNQASMF